MKLIKLINVIALTYLLGGCSVITESYKDILTMQEKEKKRVFVYSCIDTYHKTNKSALQSEARDVCLKNYKGLSDTQIEETAELYSHLFVANLLFGATNIDM